ncbi:MAG: TonB-dependent siderophore receptor [Comamonas sp.]
MPVAHSTLHPVASAARIALLGWALAVGATPAVHAADESATQAYQIAPGPLGRALAQVASAAGMALSFDPALTQGRQSPALGGSFTPQEALQRLLAGSGLGVVQRPDGSYTLQKLALSKGIGNEEGTTLAEVRVVAAAVRSDGATEGTGSYTQKGPSRTATKLPLSLRETPQSATVITRQRMDDEGMQELEDVIASTPGISSIKDGPNRVAFYSRGFIVESLTTDGLPSELSHYLSRDMNSTPDMAIYDRVEVVRGATGLTTGAGNPSAALNLVRKRPTATRQLSMTATAGSWNDYRAEVDASGPLNEAGSLRGRMVVAYQDKDSFQDIVGSDRAVLYAIAEADLSSSTMLTAGVSYQNSHSTNSWGGLPLALDGRDLGLPRSTYLGNSWDFWDQRNTTLFTRLEQRFDNDWKLQLAASRTWSRLDMLGSQVERIYWATPSQWGQYMGQYDYEDRQNSYDAYASGPFQLLGRKHELVVGASVRNLRFKGNGNYRDDEIDMDIHHWDPGSRAPVSLDMDYWQQNRGTRQKSMYATTRLSATDSLKIIAGLRFDWYDYNAATRNGQRTSVANYSVNRHVTHYMGAVYDLDAQHSVYASYTDIFKPQSELTAAGSTLKPIEGKNYEIGMKGEYFNGNLNASVALFRIDQENRAKALDRNQCSDLVSTCYEAAGLVRSQGVELEVNGRLAPGWQLAAGYTYAKPKYRSDEDAGKVGKPFATDLPVQMFKLFTTYQLQGDLHRWNVGGGVTWQSTIYNQDINFYDEGTPYHIEQKGYALANFSVGYRASEHLDWRFAIDNLFDKRYWRTIGSNTAYATNQYGEPRKFLLTARYRF